MSNEKPRTAAAQCNEYVMAESAKKRRIQADHAMADHLNQMTRDYGVTLTMGALFRYVGLILMEGRGNTMMRQCRRYLAKCIVRAAMSDLLTRGRILH